MPTTLEDALHYYESEAPRGEYVLVLEGKSRAEKQQEKEEIFSRMSIEEHMKSYEDQGIDRKEAMKLVAKDRGISKRDVYQYFIKMWKEVVDKQRNREYTLNVKLFIKQKRR